MIKLILKLIYYLGIITPLISTLNSTHFILNNYFVNLIPNALYSLIVSEYFPNLSNSIHFKLSWKFFCLRSLKSIFYGEYILKI